MSDTVILLSIKPQYAEKIFKGSKTVELRRILPRQIKQGDLVLIYVSSPVKSLFGSFRVDRVIKRPINELWQVVNKKAGVTFEEFNDYYKGISLGVAIYFSEVREHPQPLTLEVLKKKVVGFHPPQGFRYIKGKELKSTQLSKFLALQY